MRNSVTAFLLLLLIAYIGAATERTEIHAYAKFSEVNLADVTPKGWLAELLNRQEQGPSGNYHATGYPYDSVLWAGATPRKGRYGRDWWGYEQTAYFVDGIIRWGYVVPAENSMPVHY
ncbi:MAG: hypothetical protein JSU70_01630 [Phycisphaerales bacterium]|nr:MAG: hypothetical protein JSU70_01630 [Phycisphaerales bacterium]